VGGRLQVRLPRGLRFQKERVPLGPPLLPASELVALARSRDSASSRPRERTGARAHVRLLIVATQAVFSTWACRLAHFVPTRTGLLMQRFIFKYTWPERF
jgi:hypothetical protein